MHWRAQRSGDGLDITLRAVTFADARHGWVVGDDGTILRDCPDHFTVSFALPTLLCALPARSVA
jgi:hypothetical protein